MKVLFVTNGNSPVYDVTPFVKSQGDSLVRRGITIEYFLIRGKGISGYLKNIQPLKRTLRAGQFDIVHAHYSLTALTVLLACPHIPVVASYMGSDVYGAYQSRKRLFQAEWWTTILSIAIQPFLKHIICKSPNIKKYVFKRNASIIPNGVDLDFFYPDDYHPEPGNLSRTRLVLFAGDKSMPRKNYALVEKAVKMLDEIPIQIVAPFPVSQKELRLYYNTADVFVLSSLQEGSPNSVKEAMACNIPIVSTNVGDVRWLLDDLPGHYIANPDARDFADKIRLALDFGERTEGRQRLVSLGLDSDNVAEKIIEVYNKIKRPRNE